MNNYNYPQYMDYPNPYNVGNMQYHNQNFNQDVHYPDQTKDIEYQEKRAKELPKNYDVMKGFLRGNLFDSLYEPYKGYNPIDPVINNEKDALLQQVQAYMFAVTELNLYLDVNPTDRDAIKLFNEYQNAAQELSHQYVSKYGPMTIYSDMSNNASWAWNDNPWPWEGTNV